MSGVQKRKISEIDKVIAKKADDVLDADFREMLLSVIPPQNREIISELRSNKKLFNDLLKDLKMKGKERELRDYINQLLENGVIHQILGPGSGITKQEKDILNMFDNSESESSQKSYSDIVHYLKMEGREQELKDSLDKLIERGAIKISHIKDKVEMYEMDITATLLLIGDGKFEHYYTLSNVGKNILKVADTFPDFWKVLSSVEYTIDWAILNELQSGEKSFNYMINDLKMEGRGQELSDQLSDHINQLLENGVITLNNPFYALTDKGEKFIKSLDYIFYFPDPKEYLRNDNTNRDI